MSDNSIDLLASGESLRQNYVLRWTLAQTELSALRAEIEVLKRDRDVLAVDSMPPSSYTERSIPMDRRLRRKVSRLLRERRHSSAQLITRLCLLVEREREPLVKAAERIEWYLSHGAGCREKGPSTCECGLWQAWLVWEAALASHEKRMGGGKE